MYAYLKNLKIELTRSNTVQYVLLKENNNFTLARIILALLVIVGHSYKISYNPANSLDFIEYTFPEIYAGSFAVKCFFFLSGVFIAASLHKYSLLDFIKQRFFRIYPALCVTLVISTIYVSIFISKLKILEFYMNIQTYKYVVGNLLFITQYVLPRSFEKNFSIGTVNGSLWTLQFEVLLYLLAMMTYTACKYYKYNKSFIYCIHIHYTDYPSYPYIICRHGSINFTNFLFLGCYFL